MGKTLSNKFYLFSLLNYIITKKGNIHNDILKYKQTGGSLQNNHIKNYSSVNVHLILYSNGELYNTIKMKINI